MANRYDADQHSTRDYELKTIGFGDFDFLSIGGLANEIATAELADGSTISTGRLKSGTTEATFYSGDEDTRTRVNLWAAACEGRVPGYRTAATLVTHRGSGKRPLETAIEIIWISKVQGPDLAQDTDGEAAKIRVTLQYFNAKVG